MRKPVIHDQDGHADDLVATLLLALYPAVDLRAVVVNSGDCIPQVSAAVLAALLDRLGKGAVPVAWQHHALPHPFPLTWQRESLNYLRAFPEAERYYPDAAGTRLLTEAILAAGEPVTLLVTGPCTNLAAALRAAPEIARHLERVVLMAGGLEAGGNVAGEQDHDGSAEWNLYCDPSAAAYCLQAGLTLDFVSLDVTNFVPMNARFVETLRSRGGACRLAAELLAGVEQQNYFFWDTLAALLTCEPDFLPRGSRTLTVRTDPPAEGRLEKTASGIPAQVFEPDADVENLGARVEARVVEILSAL
ncbi:MAG: nucleoside hydrolase [Aphanocapsa lilacina HA4352-LM1]|nr:nucleoside hydrolase [Aphanocapsa lilacina HA4352-LM1]